VSSSRSVHLSPILILFFCLLPCQVRGFPRRLPAALIPLSSIWAAVHSVVRCKNDNRRHVQIVVTYCNKCCFNFIVLISRYFLEYVVFSKAAVYVLPQRLSLHLAARARRTTETIIAVYYTFIFSVFESTRFVTVFALPVAYVRTLYFS
jgi:hypothetical protein